MKTFLMTFVLFASFAAQAQVIDLSNGESVMIGSYQVKCASGEVQTPTMYKCTSGLNGPTFYSDWLYDQEDARQQATQRCTRSNGKGCSATSCRSN